jgi:hypothetical protein
VGGSRPQPGSVHSRHLPVTNAAGADQHKRGSRRNERSLITTVKGFPMAATWIKYKSSDNATVIFNLDQATHFRHLANGEESFVEVYVNQTLHSVLRLTDKEAYTTILNYLAMTTGYTLE